MEQQLTASLSEGEVAELVEDDEVQSGKTISEATLPLGTSLGLELVD